MTSGRSNQKARTRTALLRAATELVREGRPPSIPDAAERALISVATAYRYFPSADDLWWEASAAALNFNDWLETTLAAIEEAGPDPHARLEVCVRTLGFWMLEEQAPVRRLAKVALERSLHQSDKANAPKAPVRERRRMTLIGLILEPLRGQLPKATLDRVAHALGVVIGMDVVLALTDGVGLDVPAAKKAMLDASRWILAGALAELDPKASGKASGSERRSSTG